MKLNTGNLHDHEVTILSLSLLLASSLDTGSQSGSSSFSTAGIAGWVVAGIAVLFLTIVALVIVIGR